MTPAANPERYKNHRFPPEIISHAVWLYFWFTLSSLTPRKHGHHYPGI